MRVLMLNERDLSHPLAGGVEVHLEEIASRLGTEQTREQSHEREARSERSTASQGSEKRRAGRTATGSLRPGFRLEISCEGGTNGIGETHRARHAGKCPSR